MMMRLAATRQGSALGTRSAGASRPTAPAYFFIMMKSDMQTMTMHNVMTLPRELTLEKYPSQNQQFHSAKKIVMVQFPGP